MAPESLTIRPAALLPSVIAVLVALAGLHLVVDLFAFADGFTGAVAGALTDFKTLITGFALLAGFFAVLDREASAAPGWLVRFRTEPAEVFPKLVYSMLYVHLLQMVFAQLSQRSADNAFLISLAGHDLFFLGAATAIVATLAHVAVERTDAGWGRAAEARQLVLVGLYAVLVGGAVYTVFRFFDLVGDDAVVAFALAAYAVLEVVVGAAVVMACLRIVTALAPPEASDRFRPHALLEGPLAVPNPVTLGVLAAAGTAGVLYVLFRLAAAGDTSGAFVARGLVNAGFDVVVAMAVLYTVRLMWPAGGHIFDGSPLDDPDESALRTSVLVVAVIGFVSAIVSLWAFSEFGAGEAWYYLFNRLVRTVAAVGVILAMWALRNQQAGEV